MRTIPIPTSALRTVEYIPEAQDAELYKAEAIRNLREREQAHDRRWTDPVEPGSKEQTERDAAKTLLTAEYAEIEAEYQRMRAKYPTPQTFTIAIPTSVERDQLNSRLVALGLSQPTQEVLRATMIDELFYQRWYEPEDGQEFDANRNETIAEEHANLLDSVWMRSQAHDAAIESWQEQERERSKDEMAGAPYRPATPMPVKVISARDNARAQLLIDRMMAQSQRMRDLAANQMDFARRNAMMLVRMHLVAAPWADFPVERDPKNNAISAEAVSNLREAMDDTSWTQLVGHIDRMYQLDGYERKNSVSPLESSPLPGGSTEPSDVSADSGGNSTTSNIVPLHADASETTTDRSSVSGIVSGGVSPLPGLNNSPTDGR